ncbi:MAG: response regulator transcription factor [Halothiobacillaceae bacterium]|nr:MAG: response regulator transcription factor [Halothiobacillaceae bacterium]
MSRQPFGPIVVASATLKLGRRWARAISSEAETHLVDNLDALEAAIREHRPEGILLDLELTGGAPGLRHVLQAHPDLRTMAVTLTHAVEEAEEAIVAGAHGYIHRDADADTLRRAIDLLCTDGLWAERRVLEGVIARFVNHDEQAPSRLGRSPLNALSEREREIAGLVGDGLCYKSIARRLDISENTVRNHLRNSYRKLGLSDRLQLGLLAREYGLSNPQVLN